MGKMINIIKTNFFRKEKTRKRDGKKMLLKSWKISGLEYFAG